MALDFNLASGQDRSTLLQNVLAGRQRAHEAQARNLISQAMQNPAQAQAIIPELAKLSPQDAMTLSTGLNNQRIAQAKQQAAEQAQKVEHHKQLVNKFGILSQRMIQQSKIANQHGDAGIGQMEALYKQLYPEFVSVAKELGRDPSTIPRQYHPGMLAPFKAAVIKAQAATGELDNTSGQPVGKRYIVTRPGETVFDRGTLKPVYANPNAQFAPRRAASGVNKFTAKNKALERAIKAVPPGVADIVAASVLTGGNVNYAAGYGPTSQPERQAGTRRAAEILKSTGLSGMSIPLLKSSYKARESALRAVAKKGQVINAYMNALDGSVAKLKKAAADFGLDKLPAVNWANIRAKRWSGDPKVAAYQQAMYEVQANLGRVLSGSTGAAATTESAMKTAMDRLPEYSSPAQLSANLDQIEKDAHILSNAFNKQATMLRNSIKVLNLAKPVGSSVSPNKNPKSSKVPKNYMKYLEQ